MKSNRKGIVLMDELSLFTLALGLSKPWQVVDIRFSKEEGRLDLRIDFPRGAKFPCPTCEGQECEVHDTKDRTWRHLNFFQYETYLHARVPRVGCDRCGIKQVEVPWAERLSRTCDPGISIPAESIWSAAICGILT
jgi:transposase